MHRPKSNARTSFLGSEFGYEVRLRGFVSLFLLGRLEIPPELTFCWPRCSDNSPGVVLLLGFTIITVSTEIFRADWSSVLSSRFRRPSTLRTILPVVWWPVLGPTVPVSIQVKPICCFFFWVKENWTSSTPFILNSVSRVYGSRLQLSSVTFHTCLVLGWTRH